MTATQTLEVVNGLFKDMKIVTGGMETLLNISIFIMYLIFVLSGGMASTNDIRDALGMISLDSELYIIMTDCWCKLQCKKRYQMI
jgi:hypothetical protein